MFEHDDCINDLPTDEMLINWREANEYLNEGESDNYEYVHTGWDGHSEKIIERVYACGCHYTQDGQFLLHPCSEHLNGN